jgi:hypothetical protein
MASFRVSQTKNKIIKKKNMKMKKMMKCFRRMVNEKKKMRNKDEMRNEIDGYVPSCLALLNSGAVSVER